MTKALTPMTAQQLEDMDVDAEVEAPEAQARSEEQAQLRWRYHVTPRSAEVVIDNALTLRPHWHGPMNAEEIRSVVRMASAAPVLYEALKAAPCLRRCSRNIVDMCDRCAALALVDDPQNKS